MNQLRAALASCLLQLKLRFSPVRLGLNLIESVPVTIIYTWLVLQSNNPDLLTYILVGAPIVAVWATIALQIGYLLDSEIWNQTLLFVLISRSSITVVMLGRMLGELIIGIPAVILTFSIVMIVAHRTPTIAEPGLFVFSLVVVVLSLIAITLILAPFVVLVRGRAGFMAIFIIAGIVLGGFVYPVDRLPQAFQIVSRVLPISWGMSSVWQSIGGVSSLSSISQNWGISVFLSLTFLISSYFSFKIIEKRIRVSGTLGEA